MSPAGHQWESEEPIDETEFLVHRQNEHRFMIVYDVTQLTDGEEIEFHLFSNHDTETQLNRARKYRVQNIRRIVTKHDKEYLSSTNSTTFQEISNHVDEITVGINERILDEVREKQYSVVNPTDGEMTCSLLMKHNSKGADLNGIYKMKNMKKATASGTTYLQNTPNTVIKEATDVQFGLDLVIIGDTHIGYRNLPESSRDYRKEICREAFENLVQGSIARDVDAIIHTGDIFESSNPADEDYEWIQAKLETLQSAGIGFCFTRGNHDPAEQVDLFSQMENVMHLGTGRERQYDGFTFIGYDSTEISHPNQLPVVEDEKKMVFIHPKCMDCESVYRLEIPNIECTQSVIFAGHCHTTGRETVQGTPLIFTGSLGGQNSDRESSFYRARIWGDEIIVINPCTV